MNAALVLRLIAKDWHQARLPLTSVAFGGVIAVALISRGDEVGRAGIISALIALIMLSVLIPMITVVNERKHQNLAFVMSLPISPMEYTTSKVLGNLSAFLVLWLAIGGAVLGAFGLSGRGGVVPLGTIAALMPLVAFSLLLCVAIVSESEFWSMLMMGASNVAYSFWWILFNRVPALSDNLKSPVPVWSDAVLTVIGVQAAICVAAFMFIFVLQSRKRSFV